MSQADDFLALEPLLKARLAAVQDDGGPIDIASFRDDLSRGTGKRGRRIEVLYDGYAPQEGSGIEATIRQSWSVALSVDNVRDDAREGARSEAGPILTQILRLLIGWRPPAVGGQRVFSELQLASPMYRVTYSAGKSYFPFTFTTCLVELGNPE